jgi:hypothetical protein
VARLGGDAERAANRLCKLVAERVIHASFVTTRPPNDVRNVQCVLIVSLRCQQLQIDTIPISQLRFLGDQLGRSIPTIPRVFDRYRHTWIANSNPMGRLALVFASLVFDSRHSCVEDGGLAFEGQADD